IESKHLYTSWILLKSGKHRNSKKSLLMELQPCGNWSRELIDYVVEWMILCPFAIVLWNLSFLDGGTYGVEEKGFGTSPELIVAGVISSRAGPELHFSEAIVVSSSKSTWIVSTIRLVHLDPSVDFPEVLDAFSFGALVDSGSLPARLLLDPRQGLVRGLPKLKFKKDNIYSACTMGKSKKISHKPNSKDTNQEKLYLLHMDLCGLIRVESVNGKKYILIVVDDYSRFTWVKCLRLKDEALDFIIKFLKMIQFGISHETSVARSPQQNGIVKRRNRTLIEDARTMLIYAQAPLFLWAEAVATTFDELRAVFGHVLGASRVQIPENNLDNLHSTVEEDGTLEIVDP
nr:hypothetical protein [Tanacetum cinerariifolium]